MLRTWDVKLLLSLGLGKKIAEYKIGIEPLEG